MATIDDFKKIEMRVGKILATEKIPHSEKLLTLQVSFGEMGERQIIAGIALHFPDARVLIGQKFAFVCNLEPRKLMGFESQGMVLAASDTNTLSLLSVDQKVHEGSLVH